jgi:large subunit ribosomal protein L6
MSRVAKNPVALPAGVDVTISAQTVSVKGGKGTLTQLMPALAVISKEDKELRVTPKDATKAANMMAGTTRALLANMVRGVSAGFERKLDIVGVGYRAQVQGRVLNLTLGFSHPVNFPIPEGISIETPTVTEIVVKGLDKQKVGQVAAKLRAYRKPEPYKGKGVKYSNEVLVRKEAKKS